MHKHFKMFNRKSQKNDYLSFKNSKQTVQLKIDYHKYQFLLINK